MKIIFSLALATVLLAGCRGGLLKTPEPPVEISFHYPASDEAFYTPLIQAYQQEHPDQTIVTQPGRYGRDEETDVMVVGLFEEPPGESPYRFLDEVLAEDESLGKADWVPGALEAFREGGHLFALPYGLDPIVLFYNQELLASLGLPVPRPDWSWEDFLAYAEALTRPAEETYGYAPALGYDQDALIFIYQRGGRIFDEKGAPTFDEPETIAALDWYGRLYTQHEVTYPYTSNPENISRALIGGKVGMWLLPFSYRGPELERNLGITFKTGITALPASERQATVALFEGYAISSEAENPQACWNFLRYLLDQPNPRLVPARRSLAESDAYRRLVGEEAATISQLAVSRVLEISRMQISAFNRIGAPFREAVRKVLNGQMTAQEALEKAQGQVSGE